ncbi:extracellular solute-binding protein [Alicyclobacillus shizuokensis]|uniref:extracellular solute-binding protein n=1 Tax=Alicyclobacillus shizuokensis TaxID=392014 RepID=UPI0035716C2A
MLDLTNRKRLRYVGVSAALALSVVAAAGCGSASSGESDNTNGGTSSGSASEKTKITLWDIQTGDLQTVIKDMVNGFNEKHPKIDAQVQFFENDPYKQKLQVAMGAHNAPDIFFGWGGGILKSYIDAGDVYDLTSEYDKDPSWKNKFLPSVMKPVTFGGKIYGVPNNYVQPVFMFYNKSLFKQYNLTPPKTWDDLMRDVSVFKQHGIIPIALGGKDKWPDLMWEEYLVDRIGGPQVFNDIAAGKANAWSNPAVLKANKMIQQLVDAGAFEPGFSSVGQNDGSATALLYTGKAAMYLMGSWEFSTMQTNNKAFTQSDLGWMPFPAVTGGKGDPNDIAGNPSNYYSIATDSKHKAAAVTFLKDAVLDDQTVKNFIKQGQVPPVAGIETELKNADNGNYMSFVYDLVKKAPNFQMSWDQALSPTEAQQLLTDLDKLFLKQMTPQQFSDDMNKYLHK